LASRGSDQEREIQSITYTGSMNSDQTLCLTGPDARSVEFSYVPNREDKRTTYRYGVASMLMQRLAVISTKVGAQYVRQYGVNYHTSVATRRSLLDSVAVCAGTTCSDEDWRRGGTIPATTFTYQEDPPSYDMWHVVRPGETTPLGAGWRLQYVGDLDGDGIRD